MAQLSPQEQKLYNLLVGTSLVSKQMAPLLGISESSTKALASRVYNKLNVNSSNGRIELMHQRIIELEAQLAQTS